MIFLNCFEKIMSFRLRDCEKLFTSLQLAIKERELTSEEMAFVISKLDQININAIPEEHRNFILCKYIIHFTLLDCLIEPVNVTEENPIPIGIRNERTDDVCYKSLGFNQEIELSIKRKPDKTTFILSNEVTKKCSDCIELKHDDLQWFLNTTASAFVKKGDVIFNLRSQICCFLRGKKTISNCPSPANSNAIVEMTHFLYR